MRLHPPVAVAVVAVVGVSALLTTSCGSDGPSTSTPPVTVAPAPPSPTPPPAGTGDPYYHASCTFGSGSSDATCERGGERALNVYEDALDQLIEQQPALFDLNDEAGAGTKAYRVKDKEGYMNGVVSIVRSRGLCAERDPDDGAQETIRLRIESGFSENYDALLSSGHMRRGMGAYRESCTPANFPVAREEDAPPIGSGCGRPYPPPVSRFNCKVHTKGPEYYTLDSTPIVGHNVAYCASIGYTDGRSLCPVRPEGAPDREACEAWRVGTAQDTGRPGPTWRRDGQFCTGADTGCENHPENQYSLRAFNAKPGGVYTVAAANGASCTVDPF